MSFQGLQAGVPIVDATGSPTPAFIIYMQKVTNGIEDSSGATMPTPAPVNILADYTGTILANQLPATIIVQRFLNNVDVSAKSRWFLSTVSGSITASTDQAGVITVTALGSSSVLQAKSVRDKVTLTCNVTVNLTVGSPPSTGSGGSTNTATTYNSINSTSYATITQSDLSVTVGASGTVNLNAVLNVRTVKDVAGTYPVWGKWQWYNGTSWVDVNTEVQTSPDCSIDSTIQDTTPPRTILSENAGTLTVNTSKTGLTASSTQKFRFAARNDATTGTRTMTFSGTATAVPQ